MKRREEERREGEGRGGEDGGSACSCSVLTLLANLKKSSYSSLNSISLFVLGSS